MKISKFAILLIIIFPSYALLVPRPAITEPISVQRFTQSLAMDSLHTFLFGCCQGIAGLNFGSSKDKWIEIVTDPSFSRLVYSLTVKSGDKREAKWIKGFDLPHLGAGGIAFDTTSYPGHPDDYYFYVADPYLSRLVKLHYNSSDKEIHLDENISNTPVGSLDPIDVSCVTASGDSTTWVVIADDENHRIVIFNISQSGIRNSWHAYGSFGSGIGQFDIPLSIAIVQGPSPDWYFIYVADPWNHRVVLLRMDVSNNWYIQWYNSYTFPDSHAFPSALIATPYDGVYCLDKFKGKVYHFDGKLNRLLETQGSFGGGPGEFLYPQDISICGGECAITEEWSDSTGIQYFWLDTEIKDLRANPSRFTPSNWGAGTYLSYILTGGARVCSVEIYRGGVVNRMVEYWQSAGEHSNSIFWDGRDSLGHIVPPGRYGVRIKVIDPYGEEDQSDEDYTIQDEATVFVDVDYYPVSIASWMTAYNTGRKIGIGEQNGDEILWVTYTQNGGDSVWVGRYYPWDKIWDSNNPWPILMGPGRYPALDIPSPPGSGPPPTFFSDQYPRVVWVDTSREFLLYRIAAPYSTDTLWPPDLDYVDPWYLSPPSTTIYGEDMYAASEAVGNVLSSPPGSVPPLFGIIWWRFNAMREPSGLSYFPYLLYSWYDEIPFSYIDTLGVVIGVVPIIWMEPNLIGFPIPDTAHITFHTEIVPYFAWIRDGDVWVGRVRRDPYDTTQEVSEVINLSESLAVYYGLNLTNCRQITGESYGNMLSIGGIKREGGEDILFIATHIPNGNIFHYYPSDFWQELRATFLMVGGSSVDIVDATYSSQNMSWPTIRRNTAVAWEKLVSGQSFDVYRRVRGFLDGGWYPEENLSESFLGSCYPHTEVWHPQEYSTQCNTFWTENLGTEYIIAVKEEKYLDNYQQRMLSNNGYHNFPVIPYLYSPNGREKPSSFNICRDTFLIFNDKIYGSADIGYDSLFYAFPMLYPDRNYGIMVEFYFEGDSAVFNALVDIDEQVIDTVNIEPGVPERFWAVLPKSTYQDTQIIIGLKNLQGSFVPCSRIIIYEFGEGDTTYASQLGIGAIRGPKGFKLYQSYPNPTRKSAVIRFQIPVKTSVSLKVYDISGRLVKTLTRAQSLKPGIYTVEWDGRSDRGLKVPAGVYFYRLKTEKYKATKKMVLVR